MGSDIRASGQLAWPVTVPAPWWSGEPWRPDSQGTVGEPGGAACPCTRGGRAWRINTWGLNSSSREWPVCCCVPVQAPLPSSVSFASYTPPALCALSQGLLLGHPNPQCCPQVGACGEELLRGRFQRQSELLGRGRTTAGGRSASEHSIACPLRRGLLACTGEPGSVSLPAHRARPAVLKQSP